MISDPTPTLCGSLDPLDLAILESLLTPLGGPEDDGDGDTDPGSTWGPGATQAVPAIEIAGAPNVGEAGEDTTTVVDWGEERAVEVERAGRKGRRR
jgi:hypothetical protein